MGKCIVELKDRETLYKASIKNGEPYVTIVLGKPYTEPDLGALAKENFERGYRQRKAEDEKEIQEVYQRGLSDAWEAARKICANWCISDDDLALIFGKGKTIDDIMREFTATEAIEKIRQYEQKQEEIKVGDVVRVKNAPEIEIWVTDISDEDGGLLSGLALKKVDDNCDMGDTYANRNIYNFERTGKHYDVPTVLEKMREE